MERKRNTIIQSVTFVVVCSLLLLLSVNAAVAKDLGKMPSFSLDSAIDGKTVKSEQFKGKVLLITFFATWCPPCIQEIPTLNKLQKQFAKKDFSVLGLSVDEKGPKIVRKLITRMKINYPVLMSEGKTARGFGGFAGIPTSFLIDRDGMIIKRYTGYVPHSLLEKDIESIL